MIAGTSFVPVVDVAYYQGRIDFARLKASGVAGVIARASDGWRTGKDPKWLEYARGAAAAGLPLGSYWYQRPLDGNEGPRDQARRWISYVEESGVDVRFLMLDLEWYWEPEYPGPIPAAQYVAWLREHLDELRKLWSKPIIVYTNAGFWNTYVGDDRLASELDFVLARYHYGNTPPPSSPSEWESWALSNPKRPRLPRGSSGWQGWQFTSSLHGPDVGIEATRVDACLIRPEAWARWIGEVVVPEPVAPPEPSPIHPIAPPEPTPAPSPDSEVVVVNVTLQKLSTRTRKGSVMVKKYQSAINAVSGRGLAVDGHFGPQTEQATKDFQAYLGLTVDGWVGAQTWTTLLELK